MKKPLLSIVSPIFNEAEVLHEFLERIQRAVAPLANKYNFEILLVDDGSKDNSKGIIQEQINYDPRLTLIELRKNYGQTAALQAGLDKAKGEIIISLDADLQHFPEEIPQFIQKIEEGFDVVCGWRKDRKDSYLRVLPSKVANYIISATTGVKLHDYGCSLKAYRAKCIQSIQAYGEMHRFLPALASMTGARISEITVNHYAREYGVSKYGFDRIFKVFADIFSINLIIRFSSKPLKGFALCSMPFFLLSSLFGVLGVMALIFGWTPGKATFFLFSAALTGIVMINLLMLGILGELVVATSSLEHTQMPDITMRSIKVESDGK